MSSDVINDVRSNDDDDSNVSENATEIYEC